MNDEFCYYTKKLARMTEDVRRLISPANSIIYDNRQRVRTRNVRLSTSNKRLDLEAPTLTHVRILIRYVRLLIFNQIVDDLDLHSQGDIQIEFTGKFICDYLANNIKNTAITIKLKVACRLSICLFHLTLTHSKEQGQGQAHFDCKYLVNGDRQVGQALQLPTQKVACGLSTDIVTFDFSSF